MACQASFGGRARGREGLGAHAHPARRRCVRHAACWRLSHGLRAMWSAPETDRFLELIGWHAETVTAVYAGHTHMDELRLLGDAGAPGGFVLGTPAISPIFGQNLGFHVYDTDAGGRLVDRETWALGDLSTAGRWEREYRFSSQWGLDGFTPTSMVDLAAAIGNDGAARADWYSIFRVGRPAAWGRTGGVASHPPPSSSLADAPWSPSHPMPTDAVCAGTKATLCVSQTLEAGFEITDQVLRITQTDIEVQGRELRGHILASPRHPASVASRPRSRGRCP